MFTKLLITFLQRALTEHGPEVMAALLDYVIKLLDAKTVSGADGTGVSGSVDLPAALADEARTIVFES